MLSRVRPRLVLLPGMDGTGRLFAPFRSHLRVRRTDVVPLPDEGPQDWQSLTARVRERLPNEPFVLVAESFSGRVGAALAIDPPPQLVGVVFVAAFLSTPRLARWSRAPSLARLTPLVGLPVLGSLASAALLGPRAAPVPRRMLREVLAGVEEDVLIRRLQALRLPGPSGRSACPAFYLRASNDRLVPSTHLAEFRAAFANLEAETVQGPHFLLQARPEPCARIVERLVERWPANES